VALRGLSKSYAGRRAVADVSLDIADGEFLAILGPSGSGKTTIIRLIGGFENPDAGTISIGGQDVTSVPAERRNVNTVFQSYALFPHLSVLDNVAYGLRMRGVPRKERHDQARQFLDLVRLSDVADRKPHELSGGMQQRVALARALANKPAVLLLDEPLGALDRKLREELQQELRRIQTQLRTTFIYVTHDQEEAFGMADRLVVMRAGRIEQVGTPAEVYDRPVNAWVALFVGNANIIRGELAAGGASATLRSDVGRVAAAHIADGLGAGERAVVIVRPERTRFEARAALAEANVTNRIAAELVDSVVIGASLRQRAVTPGGVVFESSTLRAPENSPSVVLAPGDRVFVTFDAADARAYRDEDLSRASPPLQRKDNQDD
jgi:ABC-type Fe3+/spermidine/putrescine transport system ATPase subunit